MIPTILFGYSSVDVLTAILAIFILVGLVGFTKFVIKGYGIKKSCRTIPWSSEDLVTYEKSSFFSRLRLKLMYLGGLILLVVISIGLFGRKRTYKLPGRGYLKIPSNKVYLVNVCPRWDTLLVSTKDREDCDDDYSDLDAYLEIRTSNLDEKYRSITAVDQLLERWKEEDDQEAKKYLEENGTAMLPKIPGTPEKVENSRWSYLRNIEEVSHNHIGYGHPSLENNYTFYGISQPYLYSIMIKSPPEQLEHWEKILLSIKFPAE